MNYALELNGLFIFGFPIWIIIRTIILIKQRKNGNGFSIKNEVINNIFVVYIFLLLGITIFPIYIIGGSPPFMEDLSFIQRCNINVIPFVGYFKNMVFESYYFRGIIRNVGGNLVLLIPFILYLCLKNKKYRNLKSCIKAAFIISLSIESVQLLMNIFLIGELRTVDIEDVILNTLGGIVAYGIFKVIYNIKFKANAKDNKQKVI